MGGVVPAHLVLAGGLAPMTMKIHQMDGRMSLLLQANRRPRLSGIPRQADGDPLATGRGPLATDGDLLETDWSLLPMRGDPLGTGWSLPVTGGDLLATNWDLVAGGGRLVRGGRLEPIRDQVGEKPRLRIRAAGHFQQRLSRK